MSKKTDITNSIDTIDDGGLNTALEVRTVLNVLKDNSYGNTNYELNNNITTTLNVTTPIDAGHEYAITFVKQGRVVSVNGQIKNKITPSMIISNEIWFTISLSEFMQEEGKNIYVNAFNINTGDPARCILRDSSFKLISALSNDDSIAFNFQYFTKE